MINRRTMLGALALVGGWAATGAARAEGPALPNPLALTNPIANELSKFVADQAGRGLFCGTVLLACPGRGMFSAAYGMADQAKYVPNTLDTRFTTASVGKFFTAVAAARVVQDRQMTFQTTLGQAVPQLRNPALRPLTLDQLLTHTAALPQVNPEPPGTPTGSAMDYLPLVESLQLVGTPGDRFRYSNAGYLAVAMMVEQAGRLRFDAAIRGHVFAPAGMPHSFVLRSEQPDAPVAVRYNPAGQIFPMATPTGAGGFHTTVGDLVAFGHAVLEHRLLDEHYTTEVITGRVPGSRDGLYGYGCSVHTVGGHRIIEHNGGSPGANSWLQLYPDDGYTLAVLCNVYEENYAGGAQPVVDKAQQLITGGADLSASVSIHGTLPR